MSIARHHAEWLSLVPVSGPFLSLPVLVKAFPQGLDAHEPEHAQALRMAFEEWQDATGASGERRGARKTQQDPRAAQHEWIRFVLTRTLDFDPALLLEGQAIPQTLQAELPEHHEFLRPNFVLVSPNAPPATNHAPRLLIQTYPRTQSLNSYVAGSRWKASPDTRMTELLHATGVRLGLVTNGEHWMLVDAPKGESTGYASWYASLWLEEKITLRAFRSLLSQTRFFGVADDQTIEALLAESASNQQEVTDRLGLQVRRAVEVLIHSLDKADQDFDRALLADVPESVLYESALTVMMRLVFLFCAEERELIPSKPFPVYERNYSVSAIINQLEDLAQQHGEELLERRNDAWSRLLTAFRVVYGGLQHEDVYIPAYGGKLFDPDRFPFLEGRKAGTTWREHEAKPLPVNNRTVLHLLKSLQYLEMRASNSGGAIERRRLSFRALDIEQIGHVYEGLLDHTAKRATEPILGLVGAKNKEPEISLAELQKRCDHETHEIHEKEAFVEYLKDQTGKSESALTKVLQIELDDQQTSRFRTACQTDELWEQVKPFTGLIRNDTFGYPVVIPTGSVYVTSGTDRRSSGTHYTPRVLTEPIVQHTLEPLVYIGPAEGLPRSEWKLKSARELLELKICDMACGSGAFLVQACRYLAERLLEAWEEARAANPHSPGITPEGMPSTGRKDESLIPDDPTERKIYAMRLIAQRCLYGVDINPLAVEMCKLSLWLLTMAKDKPFEFLDHNIRCGDSLVGLHNLDQLRNFSLKPDSKEAVLFGGPFEEVVEETISLRLKLEEMPSNTIEDVRAQEKLLKEADDKIARLRCAADLLVSAEFWGESAKDKLERVRHAAVKSGYYIEKGPLDEFEQVAVNERRSQKMFHWPLEFPEVIVKRGGFDAFVGNPPFMHGSWISSNFGDAYARIIRTLVPHISGKVDFVIYFLRKAGMLLRDSGCVGFLLTDKANESDARKSGFEWMELNGFAMYRIIANLPWPGAASVLVCQAHLRRRKGIEIKFAQSTMPQTAVAAHPHFLAQNEGTVYLGAKPDSLGFVLDVQTAEKLLDTLRHRDILRAYYSGSDLNDLPELKAPRYVIDFSHCSFAIAQTYPALLEIVEREVKPKRITLKRQAYRDRWWQFTEPQLALFNAIRMSDSAIAVSRVSKHFVFRLVPSEAVYSDKVVVFVRNSMDSFCILSSDLHLSWALKHGSTHGSGTPEYKTYKPTECGRTFPFPALDDQAKEHLAALGQTLNSTRQQHFVELNVGPTSFFNRFHEQSEGRDEFLKMRSLHVELNQAVAAAYGWTDIKLDHGFHKTEQGVRFTIGEAARSDVLQRLLKLNHERYAEEVKQGLHDKKGGAGRVKSVGNAMATAANAESVVPAAKRRASKKPAKSKSSDAQAVAEERSLFNMEDDE